MIRNAPSPVVIVWHDAHALTSEWTDLDSLDLEPRVIRSCGWMIVGFKPGHHVLVQSLDEDVVDHALAIPDEMVREVIWLSGLD